MHYSSHNHPRYREQAQVKVAVLADRMTPEQPSQEPLQILLLVGAAIAWLASLGLGLS